MPGGLLPNTAWIPPDFQTMEVWWLLMIDCVVLCNSILLFQTAYIQYSCQICIKDLWHYPKLLTVIHGYQITQSRYFRATQSTQVFGWESISRVGGVYKGRSLDGSSTKIYERQPRKLCIRSCDILEARLVYVLRDGSSTYQSKLWSMIVNINVDVAVLTRRFIDCGHDLQEHFFKQKGCVFDLEGTNLAHQHYLSIPYSYNHYLLYLPTILLKMLPAKSTDGPLT